MASPAVGAGSGPLAAAIAALRANAPARCLELCDSLLARAPDNIAAVHLAALALGRLGRLREAIDRLARVVAMAPQNADLVTDLGRLRAAAGEFAAAASDFTAALALAPTRIDVRDDLGTAFACIERFDDARREWQQVLTAAPDRTATRLKLARLHAIAGEADAALAEADLALRHAAAGDKRTAARVATVRGLAFLATARYRDAANAFGASIRSSESAGPEAAGERGEALVGRARARLRLGDPEGARSDAEEALAARPGDEEAALALARAAREIADMGVAASALDGLIRVRPQSLRAGWARLNLIDPVPLDQDAIDRSRAQWMDAIASFEADLKLDSPQRIAEAFLAIQGANNFHLHYQQDDNLAAQTIYGRVLHRIAAARFPALAAPPEKRPARERPRVGFISAYLRQHSIWKTHGAWITGTQGFEKYVYYAGTAIEEGYTTSIRDAADAFFHLSDMRKLAELIASHELDALIWLDHGMAMELQALAALWLAPIQANGLGHPITSGLPTMTHALTSALMEPPDGAAQWTETLVPLAHTASCYGQARIASLLAQLPDQTRDDRYVDFLCAQNLAKYRPRDDALLAAIAARLPEARFNFLGDKPNEIKSMRRRLDRVFASEGLDATGFCRFHGPQMPAEYLALNRRCHVFLDTPGWSGNNTAHEAIACGLPIVTLPGSTMRARHASSLLAMMDLGDTVARNEADYVAIAVRLGEDAAWRRHIENETAARMERLFDDPAPLRSLETFLIEGTAGRS
ncbi:MAG: tetratricopeptide repeat protein [Rhodospirillaceae bacterium]|nr:tetratricopeptide repeat protein [Rhodospirillaceae bacterium]